MGLNVASCRSQTSLGSRPRHVENAGESDFLHPRPARYFAALDGVENMPFNTAWLA